MSFDPLGAEAAVKAAQPLVQYICDTIEGVADRIGATNITIGPIHIPAFTITVEMPMSVTDRLNPPPKE